MMRSWVVRGNKAIPKLYGVLLVVPYCAEEIVSVRLCVGSAQVLCTHDIARPAETADYCMLVNE